MNLKKTLSIFIILFLLISTINIFALPSKTRSVSTNPPVIEVSGTPYEMGLQHGKQAKELIKEYEPIFTLADSVPGLDIGEFVQKYKSDIENFSPALIQEMKGISDGANVPLKYILFLNVFLSLRCTTWGATGNQTKNGSPILGKTRDFTYAAYKTQIILKANPDNGHSFVGLTNAGLVGMDQFLNEEGLGAVMNMVASKDEDRGVSTMLLLRMMAENCENVHQVPSILENTIVGHGSNFLFADDSGGISLIEVAGGKGNYNVVYPEDNTMCRTNHFITQKMIPHEAEVSNEGLQKKDLAVSSSLHRRGRIEQLVNLHKGNIDLQIAKEMNQDHHPIKGEFSICRHGALDFEYDTNLAEMFLNMVFVYSGGTDSSVIVQPDNKAFRVAMGHPCEVDFRTYKPPGVGE